MPLFLDAPTAKVTAGFCVSDTRRALVAHGIARRVAATSKEASLFNVPRFRMDVIDVMGHPALHCGREAGMTASTSVSGVLLLLLRRCRISSSDFERRSSLSRPYKSARL